MSVTPPEIMLPKYERPDISSTMEKTTTLLNLYDSDFHEIDINLLLKEVYDKDFDHVKYEEYGEIYDYATLLYALQENENDFYLIIRRIIDLLEEAPVEENNNDVFTILFSLYKQQFYIHADLLHFLLITICPCWNKENSLELYNFMLEIGDDNKKYALKLLPYFVSRDFFLQNNIAVFRVYLDIINDSAFQSNSSFCIYCLYLLIEKFDNIVLITSYVIDSKFFYILYSRYVFSIKDEKTIEYILVITKLFLNSGDSRFISGLSKYIDFLKDTYPNEDSFLKQQYIEVLCIYYKKCHYLQDITIFNCLLSEYQNCSFHTKQILLDAFISYVSNPRIISSVDFDSARFIEYIFSDLYCSNNYDVLFSFYHILAYYKLIPPNFNDLVMPEVLDLLDIDY